MGHNEKLLLLWLLWMLATGAGGTVLGALSNDAGDVFTYPYMGGLIVGVAQWLVLCLYIPHAGWWVLASAFGWVLGFLVSSGTKSYLVSWVFFNSVNCAVLGVAQWLVLRHHTQYAGWWVLASAIGGAASAAVGSAALAADPLGGRGLPYFSATTVADGAAWAGNGAVTGIMLVWLLQSES